MVDRVATLSLQQTNLRYITSNEADLATLNQQISSGSKASTYDQLNGQVELISSYQTQSDRIDTYTTNNTQTITKLNLMDQAVSQIQNAAQQYATLVAQRRSVNGSDINFAQQAQSIIDEITAQLNTSASGAYLFSGTKTDTAPVTTPLPALQQAGVPDAGYYNGNNEISSVRASDSQSVPIGVLANNPAFQNLYAAIQTGIKGDADNSDAELANSVDLVNTSVDQLAAVRTGIDVNVTTLTNVNSEHSQIQTYLKQSLSDAESTDIAEASIKLSSDQTILQATFQAFASLSKLRLTNYLTNS